jgi:hypothetical protein
MMDVEVSDKPNFSCGDDDDNLFVSCEDFEFEDDDDNDDDDDHIPLSPGFPRISSLGTCSNKGGASVEKKPTTPGSVKRLFDNSNSNSLHIFVNKSNVSYDDQNKDEDDIHMSDIIKRPGKSTDKPFSSLKKDTASLEKSFEDCKRKNQVEEKRLKSIRRDIEECSRELEN